MAVYRAGLVSVITGITGNSTLQRVCGRKNKIFCKTASHFKEILRSRCIVIVHNIVKFYGEHLIFLFRRSIDWLEMHVTTLLVVSKLKIRRFCASPNTRRTHVHTFRRVTAQSKLIVRSTLP